MNDWMYSFIIVFVCQYQMRQIKTQICKYVQKPHILYRCVTYLYKAWFLILNPTHLKISGWNDFVQGQLYTNSKMGQNWLLKGSLLLFLSRMTPLISQLWLPFGVGVVDYLFLSVYEFRSSTLFINRTLKPQNKTKNKPKIKNKTF